MSKKESPAIWLENETTALRRQLRNRQVVLRWPPELPENCAVKIVGHSPSYFRVEQDGRAFTVAMACVKFIELIGR